MEPGGHSHALMEAARTAAAGVFFENRQVHIRNSDMDHTIIAWTAYGMRKRQGDDRRWKMM